MKSRISDLFALIWPLFMIMTPCAYVLPLLPPLLNLPLLGGSLVLTGMAAFYLYRTGAGKRESSFLLMARLFLLLLLLIWSLYKLVSGEFFARLYTPLTAGSLLTLASCSAGWGLTLFFARPLVMREKLISLFAPFEGKELAARTRQYSYELQEMRVLTAKLRLTAVLFTALSLTVLLVLALALGRLYTYQILFAILLLLFCLSFLFHIRGWEEELLLLSEGIRLEQGWLDLKGRRYFLILLLLALPSLLISRWGFTLPFSLLTDFFHWLGSLFSFEPRGPVRLPEMPRMEQAIPPMNHPLMLPGEGEIRPPLLSEEIKRLIRRILLGLGGAGFLLFLIFPFLSRRGRKESGGFLREGLSELIRYFSRFGGLFRKDRRGEGKEGNRRKPASGREKKRPRRKGASPPGNHQDLPSAGKVLRSFERICRWGKRRGFPYGRGITPADYLLRLTEYMPRQRQVLTGLGEFLNRYFYSDSIIEAEEIDDFILRTGQLLKEEKGKG